MLSFRRFPKEKDGPLVLLPFFFLDILNQVKQIITVDKLLRHSAESVIT